MEKVELVLMGWDGICTNSRGRKKASREAESLCKVGLGLSAGPPGPGSMMQGPLVIGLGSCLFC